MQKKHYLPFGQFVFRTPLYPCNVKKDIDAYINTDIFNEALFLASPELLEQKQTKESLNDNSKMSESLYKYFSRSFSRCTPFGLYAGCSVGKLGNEVNLELKPLEQYTRRTRLDMNYICALIQYLDQQSNIQDKLMYYPNDSIYELGGQIRYVEYYYKGTKRIHQINSVEKSEYLEKLLDISLHGATIQTLASSIMKIEDDVTYEEADEFVREVIASQILKSDLDAQTTGEDPLSRLIKQLEDLNDIPLLPKLHKIDLLLKQIDQTPLGKSRALYYQIITLIREIGVNYDLKFLFQTDMYKPVMIATLPTTFANDFNSLLEFLNNLTLPPSETPLARFRDLFYEQYEEQEVPLSNIMDNELGLGYPPNSSSGDVSVIIDDLAIPSINLPPTSIPFSIVDETLLDKYIDSIKLGQKSVILKNDDFPQREIKWDDTPSTLPIMCNIVKDKNTGEYQCVIKSIGGSSAANLLGRFCHINPEIHSLVRLITNKEQELDGDVIVAEIAHLPESRIGNIALRPILRDYEIHYLSNSGVSIEKRISISDILVSVRQNRIILRSKKFDKEIIPRLTNAHNYLFNSMPIYQFLCDMQTQGQRTGFGLNWRGVFERFTYLPRLQYKNYILSLQRWNIKKTEIKDWEKLDNLSLLKQVRALRKKYNIPQEIIIPEGDNELYVDLENILSIKTMLNRVKSHPMLSVKEFMLSDFDSLVTSAEGAFCSEFIIPFYKNPIP